MTPIGPRLASLRQDREHRKRHGIFYTPEPVARFMVLSTLKRLVTSGPPLGTLKIVDPACGDGAFLWQAYQYLCDHLSATDPAARLDVIRRQLFGVDLDAEAVNRLRTRFLSEFTGEAVWHDTPCREPSVPHAPVESAPELLNLVQEVLVSNFQVGDAVTGTGWESGALQHPTFNAAAAVSGREIHWSNAFPAVQRAGGFDVVFANPPYRRERGAKRDLAGMDASILGNTRHTARMDLWHYFFHRSLDLLKPGGTLTLIVNSAWTTSQAGQPLIARMESETTPLEFVLLERAPVFENVDGRHLILRLRKGVVDEPCRVWKLDEACFPQVLEPDLWDGLLMRSLQGSTAMEDGEFSSHVSDPTWSQLSPVSCLAPNDSAARREPRPPDFGPRSLTAPTESRATDSECTFVVARQSEDQGADTPRSPGRMAFHGFSLDRGDLFQSGRLWLHLPRPTVAASARPCVCLVDQFEVRQGIAENPPKITRKHLERNPNWRIGQGVFLLTTEELERLKLTETEQRVVRPYFETAVLDRFWIPAQPTGWLLYLTRDTAPNLEELPNISRHLIEFRDLLEQRRETLQGTLPWWHLHWPREARLFDGAKILAAQMGRYPRFVDVTQPAYVGFSVNLIVRRASMVDVENSRPTTALTLDALTAILNSRFAVDWFEHHAKRRGVHLDITGGTLKNFPLPPENPVLADQIDCLSRTRALKESQRRTDADADSACTAEIENLDLEMNRLIAEWYSAASET